MPNIVIDDSERRKLGIDIYEYIRAGIAQKGDGPEGWWRAVEKMYRNEAPTDPGKGLSPIHIPFSQPRQDSLNAQLCTVIAKQEPYMTAVNEADTEVAELKQKFLHDRWYDAGFEEQIRKAGIDCTNINRGIYRIAPKLTIGDDASSGGQGASNLVRKPGVSIDVIHPNDFVIFPAGAAGIQGAIFVGHRFYRTVRDIEALQEAKIYYPSAIVTGGSDPEEHDETGRYEHSRTELGNQSSDHKAMAVELWSGICVKQIGKDKKAQYYRLTISYLTQEVLALEPYPYSLIEYFDTSIISLGTQFWGSRSVGRNLYGLQDMYNKLHSVLYTGSMNQARPPIIGPRMTEDYTRWESGDYLESDTPVQPWAPTVTFRGDPLNVSVSNLERVGDQVARVSQNTMGSVQGHQTTATTDSIIAAGVATGLEEYIGNFSLCLPAMAAHTCDVIAKTDGLLEAIQAFSPDALEITFGMLSDGTRWECTGKTPNATPMAKMQSAQLLFQMAQDPSTGLDKHALTTVIIKNSALSGAAGIQLTQEQLQMAQMQQMQTQAQLNAQATVQALQQHANQLAAGVSPEGGGMDTGAGGGAFPAVSTVPTPAQSNPTSFPQPQL